MRALMFALAIGVAGMAFAVAAEPNADELATAYNICRKHATVVGDRWQFQNGFAECVDVVEYYNGHRGQRERAMFGWEQGYVHAAAKHLK